MNQVVKEFIVYSLKEISLLKNVKVSSYPKIILTQDDNKTETLAHFNPNNSEIVVYSKGRIYADIFRSIVHELVHYVQMKNNELAFNSGDTGTDVENEANSIAGIVLRNYTKLHPEIIKQSYSTVEPKNEIPTLQGMVEVNPPITNLLNIYKASADKIKSVIKQDSYDGCLMLQLDIPNWEILLQQIDENDLYIDSESEHIQGLEHEPHVTVLYGLSNKMDKQKLINSIKTIQNEIKVNLTEVNLFENEKFDVVKFKVESPVMHKLHSFVKENFDNNESYPTYEPHVTIAYVKKGCGSKYVKQLETPLTYSSKTFKYSGGKDSTLLECDCEENLEDDEIEGLIEYLKTAKDFINEAEYQGRKVTLNKPMRGDTKKFKVYVKNSKGKVVKVNFGSKDYNIKKNNPNRKKSYCSRSKGIKGGGTDKTKANYWSRRQWKC